MTIGNLDSLHSFGLKANKAKVLYISKLCFRFIDRKKTLGRNLTQAEIEEEKTKLRAELRDMGWDKSLIHYYVSDAAGSASMIEHLTDSYSVVRPHVVKNDREAEEYVTFLGRFGITSIASLRRATEKFTANGSI